MEWFIFILISAVFFTVSTIFKKKSLKKDHAMEFLSVYKIFQLLFILIFLIWFVEFKQSLWLIGLFYIISLLNSVGSIYLTKSYRHREVSIVSPFLNLTPLFIIILAFLLLGERINLQQLSGIAILLIGSYVLESTENFKKYLKKYWKHNYLYYTIFAVFILALGSIGDKYALGFVTPITALCFIWIFTVINIIIFQFIFHKGFKDIKKVIKKSWFYVFLSASAMMLSNLAYFYALSLTLISLVMPIKRLSTLFDSIIGGELFHEKKILQKAIACLIMIVGASLIII
jgi:uncharacterized membrane protein